MDFSVQHNTYVDYMFFLCNLDHSPISSFHQYENMDFSVQHSEYCSSFDSFRRIFRMGILTTVKWFNI
ncbi:hypothetical protein RRG08_036700 [Elysia crispata]|uniref:Uncharacterized protein n=1 Tax=Elysia crispata TaxID=231223 RepID=A0AAE0YWH9_9GAST|nr:hypothetical protein RRG08_036700 [Elysia crispata]